MICDLNEELGDPIWVKDIEDGAAISGKNLVFSVGCLDGKQNLVLEGCQMVFENDAAYIEFSDMVMGWGPAIAKPELEIPHNISGIFVRKEPAFEETIFDADNPLGKKY